MSLAIVAAAGLVLGFVAGRWWALVGPVALGGWVWRISKLEVPAWLPGLAYGLSAAAGVVVGVLLRRAGSARAHT